MSVRLRLTLWYSGILMITLLVFGSSLYFILKHNLDGEIDDSLRQRADEVLRQVRIVDSFPFGLDSNVIIPDFDVFSGPDLFLQIVDLKGRVAARSNNLGNQVLPITDITLAIAKQGSPLFQTVEVNKHPLQVYQVPLVYQKQTIYVLQVAASLASRNASLDTLRLNLILLGSLTLVAAASIGWFLGKKALTPIGQITIAAEAIQEGKDLAKRIKPPGTNDEVGRLTDTINRMLARIQHAYLQLESAYATQKQFVSDASHELRTPLTTIRGNVELLLKMGQMADENNLEALKDIRDEAERMSRLVNDLLALARADAGIAIAKEELYAAPWLEELMRRASTYPKKAAFYYEVDSIPPSTRLSGNRDLLTQMIWILLDNAFKYTPEGTVKFEAMLTGGKLELHVEDTGIGIAETDLQRIFQRFYRADRARDRSGTGLGLSIAEWIIREHEGSIEVESQQGEGTKFRVLLPILPSAGG